MNYLTVHTKPKTFRCSAAPWHVVLANMFVKQVDKFPLWPSDYGSFYEIGHAFEKVIFKVNFFMIFVQHCFEI